ncbi:MAG TPA: sulfite--cytochrome C oxidoreductase subunit B [Stellaceae bacterium]|nr:sulfite--cytochrome C oxidoreductase subunit B [Stellaceae bacterium]
MGLSAKAVACGVLALLLVLATQTPWAAAAPAASAPSTVTGSGVTLHSVNTNFPDSDRLFPGAGADAINNNCLACHSAGMVLTQPRLSRADWQAEVEKMRNFYKAPVDASDVPAIVDYLVGLSSQKQP